MREVTGEVLGVHLFPIKSCQEATVKGFYPTELQVGATGFEVNGIRDRGWVLADADMLFASQRGWDAQERRSYPQDSRLATVRVDIQDDHLQVEVDGFGTEFVSLVSGDETAPVRIFSSEVQGFDAGGEAADFFSRLLGRDVRLFQVDVSQPRFMEERYQRPDAVNQVAAADGAPFLLASYTSYVEACRAAGVRLEELPMAAYRANIEIDGFEPWSEDRMRHVRIENFNAYVVKACSRCPIPNIDQTTGEMHNLSNKVMRVPRTGWRADQDPATDKSKQYFGENLNHTVSSLDATISIGDEVCVTQWGESNVRLKRAG